VQHNSTPQLVESQPARTQVKPDITIHEDAEKKRYEIRLRRRNIAKEDQTRRFAWGNNRDRAKSEAEKWRNCLVAKYF
jgi:hypothetical protein